MICNHQCPASELLAKAIEKRVNRAIDKYVLVSASDPDGKIVGVSRAFCVLTGYTSRALTESSYALLRHPQMDTALFDDLWRTIQRGDNWIGEILNRTRDGGFFWVMADISPVLDRDNNPIGYIAVYQDITNLKSLEKLSITDPMTGAYNRRHFETVIPTELARAKRAGHYLCFLMVDADHFKRYNDTYGHQAGDAVIRAVVDILHTTFRRPGDLVFRLGGEEFGALYSVDDSNHAHYMAEKMRQAVEDSAIEHTGNPPRNRVTVSVGLMVVSPKEKIDLVDIYKNSDDALYKAKEKGRNLVVMHGAIETPDIELF